MRQLLSSILVSLLPASFRDTYRLSMSPLGCKTLCMVISFLFLRFICLCSPLQEWSRVSYEVYNPSIYPFDKVPAIEFVSSSFQVLLKYSFLIFFFHFHLCDVSTSKMPNYLYASFSLCFLIITWFGCSTPSVMCRLLVFIKMVHFSMPNSIPISWLYIPTVFIRVSSSFCFLQTVWYRPCTSSGWSFLAI